LVDTVGADYKHLCYHYRGEFLADSANIRRAVEDWGDVMQNMVLPALESGNDPTMGHALERMWVTLLTKPRKV